MICLNISVTLQKKNYILLLIADFVYIYIYIYSQIANISTNSSIWFRV